MECTASFETEPITTNSIHPSGQEALQVYIPEALYWKHYYDYPDINYEWNNGQLEVVPVADYARYMMYLWFLDLLRDLLHVQPIARIIGLGVSSGWRCRPRPPSASPIWVWRSIKNRLPGLKMA